MTDFTLPPEPTETQAPPDPLAIPLLAVIVAIAILIVAAAATGLPQFLFGALAACFFAGLLALVLAAGADGGR